MKWDRCIVHSDLNHCYAQIEEMLCPDLRNVPMAVGGSEESRHGIILAKNDIAKEYGIKTAESLREAYKKCPKLLIVNPHYQEYIYYTEKVKDIYREYTDHVESFGLDEAWIDLTDSQAIFGDPIKCAKTIQNRIADELGLKVSMGISFNKVFAKLGSDMDKKSGFSVITKQNYKEIIYPLPCEELLFVGRATKEKLNANGIYTIGDIASCNINHLNNLFGKNGEMLWRFANGYDDTLVKRNDEKREVKSVGNGITAIRDLMNFNDIRMIFWVLSESVAQRLKEINKRANVISISLRNSKLESFTRQKKISESTNLSYEIMHVAMELAYKNIEINKDGSFKEKYRTVTISASGLEDDSNIIQMNLFIDEIRRRKDADLERAYEKIRNKYGHDKICRLVVKMDEKLTGFNPKDDHVIHPESWF